MVEKKIVIALAEPELLDLEAIVVDGDREEALRFLRDVVKRKVDEAQKAHCKPPNL